MYATVNHRQASPSSLNSDVPPMLDLIVAKALAKSVDERYQSMRDMVQDLAEVKRLLHAAAPAGRVIATKSPPPSKPAALDALGVGVGRYKKDEDEPPVAPLSLAKKFDSFDATVKLAAMTQQTPEFEGYISETKKMRAYTGDISGLDQRAASVKAALAPAASVESATVPMAQLEEMELAAMAYAAKQAAKNGTDFDLTEPNPSPPSPGLPIGLLVVVAGLAIAAVALLVALFA
jgi:serine/threonine-protein kinase